MNINLGVTRQTAECENVTVTTAAGKTYDLGKPSSPLFKARVAIYKMKRGIK